MTTDLTLLAPAGLSLPGGLPALITTAGERTAWRFVEFFTATIRNPNTREAYARAVGRFLACCEGRGLRDLRALTPVVVAAYIEQLPGSKPTVKQHLSAIRQCLDWLVTGGALETNPAASVRGSKYVIKKGKTPGLDTAQTRALLEAIDTATIVGLHDRALIGAMVYSFARVSAIIGMRVERTTTPTASAGGSACTRRAANSTRCRRTTRLKRIWTPTGRSLGLRPI